MEKLRGEGGIRIELAGTVLVITIALHAELRIVCDIRLVVREVPVFEDFRLGFFVHKRRVVQV